MRIFTIPVAGTKAKRWRPKNHQTRLPDIEVGESFIAWPTKRDGVPEDIGFVQRCAYQMIYRKRKSGEADYTAHTERRDFQSQPEVIHLGEKCVVVHRIK